MFLFFTQKKYISITWTQTYTHVHNKSPHKYRETYTHKQSSTNRDDGLLMMFDVHEWYSSSRTQLTQFFETAATVIALMTPMKYYPCDMVMSI